MKKILFVCLLFASCATAQPPLNLVPQPASVKQSPGAFHLTQKTTLVVDDAADKKSAAFLNSYLKQYYGFSLKVVTASSNNYIRLSTKKGLDQPGKDGYSLRVTKEGVAIDGDTYAGTFYGVQTALQLLPLVINKKATANHAISFVTITDAPRFGYRGMHLDVCRHFFPIAFIKKYIDYLALHKMNYFHWHLTDDQGWRIEIKKYPLLTSKAAYRNGSIIGRYPGTGNDNQRYGGFYTQEEAKEIVAYAADRFIIVVPEIEMPGHASAAIAAYPWLSCFPNEATKIPSHPSAGSVAQQAAGSKKQVQETWGVFEDVFNAGKDSTFAFLQDVLDEVMPLFPSPYIHIGGDESPKAAWKRSPECQARIKELGLKDEHGLQSYFVQRIEKYVNSKGKTIIGWDEILEGGLAPNAVVMSWQGEKGGITAAKQKHYVIMTPQKPVYFDHTQTRNEDSLVIGGYNPLEAVYAYEPVPKELSADEAKYILGAQANLWTEYITNPAKVEYMVFPRMSALSEVLWSPKEKRDWKDFERRLPAQFGRYEMWKAGYSKAYYDLSGRLSVNKRGKMTWTVTPKMKGTTLRFTPVTGRAKYVVVADSSSFLLPETGKYYVHQVGKKPALQTGAIDYVEDIIGTPLRLDFVRNKATGKRISITSSPTEKYPGQGGAFGLVNGIYSNKGLSHPDWLGWVGSDLEATIDLGAVQSIYSVRMHTLNQNGSWIYLPQYVEVFTSADGKTYSSAGKASAFVSDTLTMGWIAVPLKNTSSRYLKLVAKNYGLIPDGQPGGGNKAWLFADELQVY